MMGDLRNVLLAACGIGTVCCGSFALALFLLLNITGRLVLSPTLMGLLSLFKMQFSRDDQDDEDPSQLRSGRPSASDSIQAKIQAANQDFQQSLRQERPGGKSAAPPNLASSLRDRANQIKGSNLLDDHNETPSLRKRGSRPRRDEDDIVGYDEDGDDLLDF